jgi:hypothetical protein
MAMAVESHRSRSKQRACGINMAREFFRAGVAVNMTKE